MPTYEYECLDCKTRFEKFQSITAEPLKDCPTCGEHNVKAADFRGSRTYIQGVRLLRNGLQARQRKRIVELRYIVERVIFFRLIAG